MKKIALVSIVLLLLVIVGCTPAAPAPSPGMMPVRGGQENVQGMQQHMMPDGSMMGNEEPMPGERMMNHSVPNQPMPPTQGQPAPDMANAKVFSVEAFQFGYEPNEIHVKEGDTVTINLATRDVGHSLTIRDLGVSVPATPGHPGTQTFVAGKKGSFTWRCHIPCGAGHESMHGTLVVE